MTEKLLLEKYPNETKTKYNFIIKYQKKFNFDIKNIKCLNPDCKKLKAINTNTSGLAYCCSIVCKNLMKNEINLLKSNKRKHTSNYIYGCDHPMKNDTIKTKCFKKILTNNGSHPFSNKESLKETCLMKYGVDNPMKNHDIKQRAKETCLMKYGVDNPMKNHDIKQRAKETYFDKTGLYSNNYKYFTNLEYWNDKQYWIDTFIINNDNFDYISCMEFFNCNQVATHHQIKKLGIKYKKFKSISLKEQALYPFLDSLNFIYETNVRNVINDLELDIYFPELDLAIEYNGLYWHSYHESIGTNPKQLDLNYMKYRHQAKSLACLEKGIRLLHIYEDTEDIENLIINFLKYEPEGQLKESKSYELDSGCYPLGLEYEAMEPESRIVNKNRYLYNAGGIKIKEENK